MEGLCRSSSMSSGCRNDVCAIACSRRFRRYYSDSSCHIRAAILMITTASLTVDRQYCYCQFPPSVELQLLCRRMSPDLDCNPSTSAAVNSRLPVIGPSQWSRCLVSCSDAKKLLLSLERQSPEPRLSMIMAAAPGFRV